MHDVRCASDIASAQSQELAGQDRQECAEVQDLYATGNCTEPAPDTTGLCSTPVLRSWKFVQENGFFSLKFREAENCRDKKTGRFFFFPKVEGSGKNSNAVKYHTLAFKSMASTEVLEEMSGGNGG